jgi:simple sugar transport system permease protein
MTRKTALGMFIESVGINSRSSFFSGINERRVKLVAYMVCGFCAGMAGLVASSNIRTSDANNIGLNYARRSSRSSSVALPGRWRCFSLFASIIGARDAGVTSRCAIGCPPTCSSPSGRGRRLVIVMLSAQVRDVVRRAVAAGRHDRVRPDQEPAVDVSAVPSADRDDRVVLFRLRLRRGHVHGDA